MRSHRLFLTTRGKVLLLLKKRGPCTVAYLGAQLGLTNNAIRQHLAVLERENLVDQQPVKNGPRKPVLVYSLTSLAGPLFPKQYDGLLTGLMGELLGRDGSAGLESALSRLGASLAAQFAQRLGHASIRDRRDEVTRIMEETGAIVEWDQTEAGMVLRDFNCPYSALAQAHPEVCKFQQNFLGTLLAPAQLDVTCVRHEANLCEFRVTPTPENTALE